MARVLGIVLVVLALSRVAAADPIVWSGASCGDAAALATAVELQRGRPLVDADGLRVAVTVTEADVLAVHLELETADGIDPREIRGRDCAALVEAVALIVVLALEDLEPPPIDATPLPVPIAVPPPPPWRTPSPPAPVLDASRSPLGARFRAGAVAESGALPGLGLGAAATLSLTRRWASVEVGFEAHGARSARVGTGDASADVGLVAGAARGCAGRGAFELCVGAAVGRIAAEGMDVLEARAASRRWSAAQLGARWRHALLGRFAVVAAVDGTVALDRPRFVLDDGTLVYQPAPAGLALTLAVEVRLR